MLLLPGRNLLGPTAVFHKGPPTNLFLRSLTIVMAKVSKTGKHKSWGELKTEPQILYPSPVLLTSHMWPLQAENALLLRVPNLLYNPQLARHDKTTEKVSQCKSLFVKERIR